MTGRSAACVYACRVSVHYAAHRASDPLPKVGSVAEKIIQEFKREWLKKPRFHVAKVIASFANTLGGTVFVGGVENGQLVSQYRELSTKDTSRTIQYIEDAVAEMLRPFPAYDIERCNYRNGIILAVNVEPLLTGLSGVRVEPATPGYKGKDGWAFPVRTMSRTKFLSPDELPMHLEPKIRRMVLLLNQIPTDTLVSIRVGLDRHHSINRMDFIEVQEDRNRVEFRDPQNRNRLSYPLDQIETVYFNEDGGGHWHILFRVI